MWDVKRKMLDAGRGVLEWEKEIAAVKGSYLLRRFTIFFCAFSVTPLILLFYLYFQYQGETAILINKGQFLWFTLGIGLVSILGFFGIRGSLVRIVLLSDNLKKALFRKVDGKVIINLAQGQGEVAELAKSFGDIFKKLESNIGELEYTKRKLHEVLSKVAKTLTSMEDFDSLIQLILETTVDAIGAEKGLVFSVDEKGEFLLKSRAGFAAAGDDNAIMSAARASLRWVANEKNVLVTPQLAAGDKQNKVFSAPLVWSPLVFRDKIWGVLCLSGKKAGANFDEGELTIISNLSSQMAISFENVRLSSDRERTHFETIAALAMAVEAKDSYSRGHSDRVGKCALKLGQEMGLPEKDLETLRDASRLHDLGKIGIADKVLKKKGGLSSRDREMMLRHSIIGESIIRPLKTFQHLLDPIRHHHEYLDGSGYPDGLKGGEISLVTRILTVADIYDALAKDRPYRKALPKDELKRKFQGLVDEGKLDKDVVAALFNLIEGSKL